MSYVIIVVIVYKDHHRHHFDKRFAIMTEEKKLLYLISHLIKCCSVGIIITIFSDCEKKSIRASHFYNIFIN